jgi:membrane carboxypeptidase/penicillin-binding protein PbpC
MKYILAAALFFALLALAVGQDSSTVTVTKATQPVQTVQTVQAVQATKEVVVEQKQPTVITQVATNQFPVNGVRFIAHDQDSITTKLMLCAYWLLLLVGWLVVCRAHCS